MISKINLNIHFNAPNVRHETWQQLCTVAGHMAKSDEIRDSDVVEAQRLLDDLATMERFWRFPSPEHFQKFEAMFYSRRLREFYDAVTHTANLITTGEYRDLAIEKLAGREALGAHYFEVLVVSDIDKAAQEDLRSDFGQWRSKTDEFIYDLVFVPSIEDAVVAILFNFNIQACLILDDFKRNTNLDLGALDALREVVRDYTNNDTANDPAGMLIRFISQLRPELDVFLCLRFLSEEMLLGHPDVKTFHHNEPTSELHFSITKAVRDRYRTPFFDAIKQFSAEPAGAFHALPVSRGNSVFTSAWLKDFAEFYGRNVFLGESSATTEGLDYLLQPRSTLKDAQERASRCYGSDYTFFVTTGTSSSNRIVLQALMQPGDIVLTDRSCHQSHHFAFLLSGSYPYYLNTYSLDKYSIAGAVQLLTIKKALLDLYEKGLLEQVKMVDLTNCTFDGLTYNVERYMEEILAIKPDMIFAWDEAWFGFARFVPHYRQRTAMFSAEVLRDRYSGSDYREQYRQYKKKFLDKHQKFDSSWISQRLLPDPDKVVTRVYATQSTHKTLGSFRQGSMIHVRDELFDAEVRESFLKAYMAHTTTSPNYHILASLDVSRRQAEMEGFELVQRSIELALLIRRTINSHPLLSRYFQAMGPSELIPQEYRHSGVSSGFDPVRDWQPVARAWEVDDFVLDPCRITMCTSESGIDGFTLKNKLASQFNIQVNKAGINSICLMTNIGTTRNSVAHLIRCLIAIAKDISKQDASLNRGHNKSDDGHIPQLTASPPLPEFSGFHKAFQPYTDVQVGDLRRAFFAGTATDNVEYHPIADLKATIASGEILVSATFIVPMPPGFPLLVPGQIIDRQAADFVQALPPNQVLGVDLNLGIQCFKPEYLKQKP